MPLPRQQTRNHCRMQLPEEIPRLPVRCRNCGTELAAGLLACPSCHALVHAERLGQLASAAEQAGTAGEALVCWREAFNLLPPNTVQQRAIVGKIDALVKQLDHVQPPKPKSAKGKVAAGASFLVVLLAKFKFILLFALTKLKFLALGLTKMGTLLSMFLSFGLYWSLWGWKFAAGFILSIYIHEMGHVAMLRRLGVRASAPMFIPGFGALILLKQHLPTPREDARVGLAGPIWGLGAAIAAWLLGLAFHSDMAIAIAKVGAWINLFNLTPIWQLDGSRAFRAFSRNQRIIAMAAVGVAIFFAAADVHGILFLVGAFGVFRLFEKNIEKTGDTRALVEYVLLVAALTALASLPDKI